MDMQVVALLSGGKDSCFNALHCVSQGHSLVALATLSPEQGKEELDSYLYQTVGQDGIAFIAEAMELPLFRHTIRGSAVDQSVDYTSHGSDLNDETEDLYKLLSRVKTAMPQVNAVSVGAILSNYQRTRVEHVCRRLGMTCLAYLWHRDQVELLDEMEEAGMVSVIIKVAGAGLQTRHLGQNVLDATMRDTLRTLHDRFELHPCGEGGEYETFTLDCPLFKKRIDLYAVVSLCITLFDARVASLETEIVNLSESDADRFSTVAYLRLKRARLVDKEEQHFPTVLPPLLDQDSRELLQSFQELETVVEPEPDPEQGSSRTRASVHTTASPAVFAQSGDYFAVSNMTAPNQTGIQAETAACFDQLKDLLAAHHIPSLSVISHINLYLSDMADFAAVNAVYATYFNISPPTRACVAIKALPLGCHLVLDVVGCTYAPAAGQEQRQKRSALHVQSKSFWAPANIGPYSQAVMDGDRIYIAGQIGLIPSLLTLPDPQSLEMEMVLSLQHAKRIMAAFEPFTAKHVESVICWLASLAWTSAGREMATRCWKDTHVPVLLVQAQALPKDALVEWQLTCYKASGANTCIVQPLDASLVSSSSSIQSALTIKVFHTLKVDALQVFKQVNDMVTQTCAITTICVEGISINGKQADTALQIFV